MKGLDPSDGPLLAQGAVDIFAIGLVCPWPSGLTTRLVIENKRLPELVESQGRYLTEPRVWTRRASHNEKDQMVVTARVSVLAFMRVESGPRP